MKPSFEATVIFNALSSRHTMNSNSNFNLPERSQREYIQIPGPPNGREEFAPPPGPPPGRVHSAAPRGLPSGQEDYAPPPGPPPRRGGYTPPSEWSFKRDEHHRPSKSPSHQTEYLPPPGPPSSQVDGEPLKIPQSLQADTVYQGGGPPPRISSEDEPPPYHDWTVIPDTALLPPPPVLGHNKSPINNANANDADRAHNWCLQNLLLNPHQPSPAQHASVKRGEIKLMKPKEFHGNMSMSGVGRWRCSTKKGSKDSSLITSSPLYFASSDSPWNTKIKKHIYYELRIQSLGHGPHADESAIALGFCAMPYPTWRLPGWERGSLAVHSDDGRRYINDTWGGKDFTSPFQVGDTIGLGISFSLPTLPLSGGSSLERSTGLLAEVFFTKNGVLTGGWNLHEELDDTKDLGIQGLDGQHDLYGVVGVCGVVKFDCLFHRRDWLWLPR